MCAHFPNRAYLLAMITLAAACSSATDPPDPLPLLLIEPSNLSLAPGGKRQLSVTMRGVEGTVRSPTEVVWSSTDDGVATVSADGIVTANQDGTAQIAVWWEGYRAFATVRVFARATPPRCGRLLAAAPHESDGKRSFCAPER